MEIFEWRGRAVAWERMGTGPPMVLCHGTPWSSRLWAELARGLAAEFTVHLYDMPGYGESSKHPEHAVDLGTQGEVLADLLDHWGLDRPRVVAHDYGGAVSLRAHLLHGRGYRSLTLVDVVALRPWGSEFFRLVKEHADVFARQPPVVHRGALEAYIRTASHRGLTGEQLATLTAPWLTTAGQRAFYRQIAEADERFTDEIEPRYAELDLPVTVIWGAEDTWIPVDRARRLASLIPGARTEIITGAGHLVQYDAPAELALAVRRSL
ncbi:MAG: alpha/beta fold hydrolase [Actinophytocola sp.]|uniref:alpha/beta fold hydrolase n=1 Tax=Actinophytocola sp. TaxID=1872138 RepID=UPI001324E33F|nr:alpha/beta hydrolase [Actinophytocola sp.]MPZ85481.1 alpha/beta fold hydrolase [Actinophytocola sp.]